ncbi:MAG: hypothetical protein ACRDRV_02955 [Pseudonocardiaceae bacterium]
MTSTTPSLLGRRAEVSPGGLGRDLSVVGSAVLLLGAAVWAGGCCSAAALVPARQAPWWLAGQAVVALTVNHLMLTGW